MQAGVLEALYERWIRPDLLVGTSAGAINAAFIASRPPGVETAHELQRIWCGLRRSQVLPASPLTAGLGFLGLRGHSVSAAERKRTERALQAWCECALQLPATRPAAFHLAGGCKVQHAVARELSLAAMTGRVGEATL